MNEAFPRSHGTLFGLGLTMLLAALSTSIVTIALPSLARELSVSFHSVQWVLLAHLLTVTTFMVSAGKLGDLLSRKRLLLGGIFLFSAAALLASLAPSFPFLLGARALQGLGAAIMMAQSLALVSVSVEKKRTGRALGLLGSMSAVGTALGPALGGLLTEELGVRSVFWSQVPIAAVAFLFVSRFVATSSIDAKPAASFDRLGTLLLGVSVGSYALAMTRGSHEFLPTAVGLLALAAVALLLFVRVELKAKAPLVDLQKVRSPAIGRGLATSALVSTLIMTTLVVGPFYLSGALGLGPSAVGLVLAVGPGVAALMGYAAGRLVDRFGSPRITRLSLGAMVLASTGLASVSLASFSLGLRVAGYVAPLALVTGGYALFQTANNTGVMGSVPREERGVVSGLLNLSRNLGLITGASLMSAVFAFAAGAPDAALAAPAAIARATGVTYALGAGLALLSFRIASRSQKRPHERDTPPVAQKEAPALSRAIASSALRSGSSRLLR
jgi:MFS family permease